MVPENLFILFLASIFQISVQDWSPFANSTIDYGVYSIVFNGSDVYLGGYFKKPFPFVCKWSQSGQQFSSLGKLDGGVTAMIVNGGDLFLGGSFALPFPYIARWDGSTLNPVGDQVYFNAPVQDFASNGTNIFVGGSFSMPYRGLTMWDGKQFQRLGHGPKGIVNCLAVNNSNGMLYAAGYFNLNKVQSTLVVWDGVEWRNLPSFPDAQINALAMDQTNFYLYVGGWYGVPYPSLSMWDGSQWFPVGNVLSESDRVYSLGFDQSSELLYVGGMFDEHGRNIASWDGVWNYLGLGTDGFVMSIAANEQNQHVLIGGEFSLPYQYVAEWTSPFN